MSLAIVNSRANLGLSAPLVTIEVHISKGFPGLSIVGLPEKAVKESKERVRSALTNNAFEFPVKRIVINLAPADLPKEGGRFDLPIALGILAASDQIPNKLNEYEFVGELALTGELKGVKGVLPMALMTYKTKRALLLPFSNAKEASLAAGLTIFPAKHLREVCQHLANFHLIKPFEISEPSSSTVYPNLSDVCGQSHAKRALEIAAAGGHSILFSGPPGTGKTMLSSRLPGILPEMTEQEAQTTAVIYSVSSKGFDPLHWKQRPFRSPHHTASSVALVGGGSPPKPGEISLAHNGVLFLDELPEFHRHVLEALREPLESGVISISRAGHQALFPSQFQFIGAMNPCPCGYYGDVSGRCRCTKEQILRYQGRLSGPLLDRIDMHVLMPQLPISMLLNQKKEKEECSSIVRERVLKAREKQLKRCNVINAQLNGEKIKTYCLINDKDQQFLETAIIKLGLSSRAYFRFLKLSRTIADIENCEEIQRVHLQEALSYRKVTV